jgi:hypothetical protein
MNLKNELCYAYKRVLRDNNYTYKELCYFSGLSESQLASILHHNAEKVSLTKMESGLNNLGFEVTLCFHKKEI